MKAAETTRYELTAHSTPAALRASSVRMLGSAAMIAVLLAPTASIARHDDHSTDANPARWLTTPYFFIVARSFIQAAIPALADFSSTPSGSPATPTPPTSWPSAAS